MTWMLIILLLIVISYLLIKGKTQTNIEPVSKFGKMPCDEPPICMDLVTAEQALESSLRNKEDMDNRLAKYAGFDSHYDYQKSKVIKRINHAIKYGSKYIHLYKTFEDRPKEASRECIDWDMLEWCDGLEKEFSELGYYLREQEYTSSSGGYSWTTKYMCLCWDAPNTHPQ